MALERKIATILSSADQIVHFETLLNEILSTQSYSSIKTISQQLVGEDVPPQISKALMLILVSRLKAIIGDIFQDIATHILDLIKTNQTNTSLYDEIDYILRDSLFLYYIQHGAYTTGAQVLSGLNLDSTIKKYTDLEKADILIKISEAYLEDDETVEAEIFCQKAAIYMYTIDDFTLNLRYRTTFARILDANRKFLEASSRYYELSTTTSTKINADDLLQLLGKAVTCAILGKSGNQRSRIIDLLCKDERLTALEQLSEYSAHSSILYKIYKNQLLQSYELNHFESTLASHQKAITSDGYTILQKAILEHNMIAIQYLYDTISINSLATILNLDVSMTMKIITKMIIEDRLLATIDQTEVLYVFLTINTIYNFLSEGYLIFKNYSNNTIRDNIITSNWDKQIAQVCDELSSFHEDIKNKYPHLLKL